jgi:hypothetical protein
MVMNYQDWHIPLHENNITLGDARKNLAQVSAIQDEIPLMVQLIENPKYKLPGITLFHGAVDLKTHDCIHIILGRGLLPIDEAFTIGFTMGSTNRISATEEQLFSFISKNLYPDIYKFSDRDLEVFKNAIRLAFISSCKPLDTLDYSSLMKLSLKNIRNKIELETDLLEAYYAIEKKRYPESLASQRL